MPGPTGPEQALAATSGQGALQAALLQVLLEQPPATTRLVLDTDLRGTHLATFSEARGTQRSAGRRLTEVYHLDHPDEAEHLLRTVLDSGIPAEQAFRGRPAGSPAPDHSLTVRGHRLDDPRGRALGVLVTVADDTDRDRARDRDASLAAVREVVGRTLDVTETCRGLAEAAVLGLADVAVVEIVDDVLRGAEPPVGPLAPGVPLRRAAFRSRHDSAAQAHPVGDVRGLPHPSPYALALSDLQPRIVTLSAHTPWLRADPSRARAIEAAGAHSLLVTPLTLRGTVLGLVSLYRCGDSHPYDESDLTHVLTMAAQTALGIDNARRYERDHTIAAALQRRLLPQRGTAHLALDSAQLHLPGRNSGCWFDTIALSGERTALVMGNVAGHGIHTAATMGQLRTAIHALAALDLEPDELLARLNDTATRLARERAALPPGDPLHRQPLTATCAYGVYDPFTRTCSLALAGHPAPLVVDADGTTSVPDIPEGPQLSSPDTAPYPSTTLPLDEGTILAFCTGAFLHDGTSVTDPVRDALAGSDRRLRHLCDAAAYTLPGDTHHESAAILLARAGTIPAGQVAQCDLADGPTAPSAARGFTRDCLTKWEIDDETVFAAELITSELVTNAVRYGAPPVSLRLIRGRTLTCEVRDSSSAAPHLRHARTVDEGGRGLFIVSQLATQWGTRYSRNGKTLWTEQPLRPDQ